VKADQQSIGGSWQANGGARSRPVLLGIAGDSAAGKTTLSTGIVEALGPDRCTSICVDDYHRYDRAERAALSFTPLHPDCNYMDVMQQHLQLLALGQPILKPVYDHRDGSLGRPVLVEPREFVIAEGLLPLHTRLSRACFDVTVFLDPPEPIRQAWKIRRDTRKRGYEQRQVLDELARRETESQQFIRPQRRHADVVVRFSPIEERGESADDPLSATLLLRPTIAHPDLSRVLGDDVRKVMHLKLLRDEDGKPVDALHIHGYAPREQTGAIEDGIWSELRVPRAIPDALGRIDGGERSEPLALTQLILLFHLFQAHDA
jgi:phosphoribulokinase